jgi:hypothetical protein
MKMLSLLQPWATLVVLGAKRYETRSWQTLHRGPLAIHASARLVPAGRALCRAEPVRTLLHRAGYADADSLPVGAALGAVELLDCLPADEVQGLTPLDLALGDFRAGRWAWYLARPRRLTAPLPWRGCLSVFDGPDLPDDLFCPPSPLPGGPPPPRVPPTPTRAIAGSAPATWCLTN